MSHALEKLRERLLLRFRNDALIPHLEITNVFVRSHFVVDASYLIATEISEISPRAIGSPHAEAVWEASFLRRVVPGRESYGTRGYGHQLRFVEAPYDDSHKDISTSYLPPDWATKLNALYMNLATYVDRPDDWEAHARNVYESRKNVILGLESTLVSLDAYYRRPNDNSFTDVLDAQAFEVALDAAANKKWLPKVAVDEWGYISESTAEDASKKPNPSVQVAGQQVRPSKHSPYLAAMRGYFGSLENFFRQSRPGLQIVPYLRRATKPEARRLLLERMQAARIEEPNLKLAEHNLTDAISALDDFQREFRTRFCCFVEDDPLNQLERREREVATNVYGAWSYFVHTEVQVTLSNPKALFKNVLANNRSQFIKDLKRVLRASQTSHGHFRLVSENVLLAVARKRV